MIWNALVGLGIIYLGMGFIVAIGAWEANIKQAADRWLLFGLLIWLWPLTYMDIAE